jgi:hypothetical protein
MSKAHGSECDTAGIFTTLENSVHVGRATGAELSWDWLGTGPVISPLPVALSN